MRGFALLLIWAALLVSSVQARAQMPGMEIHVHAGLAAETLRPKAGSTVTLAITMRPDAGWHGYWINPGDAGEGLMLDWKLPSGVTVGAPRFPVPETLIISGFMNYVYERPHAVLVDLTLPAGLTLGAKIPVSVDANWLACTDRVCVPQQGTLRLDLSIGDGTTASASRARFDTWRADLPVPLDREARYKVDGKQITIAIPYAANAAVEDAYFFPLTSGVFNYAAPQNVRRSGDWLIVETQLSASRKSAPTALVEGLFRNGREQGLAIKARPGSVPSGGAYLSSGPAQGDTPLPALGWLLMAAFAGGLILNVLPCVFPILGLKALALSKIGGDERAARIDALAYTAGVVVSCVALGAALLALRAGGEEMGWAFQLQEPVVILFLLMLMAGITANLAGLFEIGGFGIGGRASNGAAESFMTGVLAAFVATPCTGPFMAAALGASLLLPVPQAILLFLTLGIGLAWPFLLLAFVPALRSRLPKPGAWMEIFRKTMAVPMGLTAMALAWLLWRLSGQAGLILGLSAVSAFLLLLGLYARLRAGGAGVAAIAIGATLTVLAASQLRPYDRTAATDTRAVLPSEAFSIQRLASLRAAGKPVFVYFTADWCVSCKIIEAAVLERAETAQLFQAHDVAVLRGDFTKRDVEIARFLSLQGAAGVPLYLYYPKGADAVTLPQLLTAATLTETVIR